MSSGLPATGPLFLLLIAFSFLPMLALMTTSFIKISVVMSLIRNALGIQQIPPNMALHAFAFVLTLYIMAPVFSQTVALIEHEPIPHNFSDAIALIGKVSGPFEKFLTLHAGERDIEFFKELSRQIWQAHGVNVGMEGQKESLDAMPSFAILIPAFMLSELTEAFEIGFMLYLPFIAIDLVVSNILLAMGMMMVSPMTISLPLKLFLFVMLDGWRRMIEGLVLSYSAVGG